MFFKLLGEGKGKSSPGLSHGDIVGVCVGCLGTAACSILFAQIFKGRIAQRYTLSLALLLLATIVAVVTVVTRYINFHKGPGGGNMLM